MSGYCNFHATARRGSVFRILLTTDVNVYYLLHDKKRKGIEASHSERAQSILFVMMTSLHAAL